MLIWRSSWRRSICCGPDAAAHFGNLRERDDARLAGGRIGVRARDGDVRDVGRGFPKRVRVDDDHVVLVALRDLPNASRACRRTAAAAWFQWR